LVESLSTDLDRAALSDPDRHILGFARRLTLAPADDTRDDVELLRADGFSDRAILDVTLVTAYFNFVNRIASGLGVELEGTTA
jgi:uncharacterized peroxidase-related enzyme